MAVNQIRRNGSFAPLSAHYYKDDRVAEVGERAELLYLRGLAFCADVLSDGYISDVQLARFVGVGLGGVKGRADRLCEVGLWERNGSGFIVTAWKKWNLTKDEIQERQRRDSGRKTGGNNAAS
jgi:hypothetical protein